IQNNLLSLGARSLEIYNETVVILSLRDAAHIAATHSPPFQFRWVSEPDEIDAGPGPGLFTRCSIPSSQNVSTPRVNRSARRAPLPGSKVPHLSRPTTWICKRPLR